MKLKINKIKVNSSLNEIRPKMTSFQINPVIPNISGAHLGMTSDGFFDLDHQPKKIAIVGAGYIAVEFAGISDLKTPCNSKFKFVSGASKAAEVALVSAVPKRFNDATSILAAGACWRLL